MKHLQLRSNLSLPLDQDIPFAIYTVGTEDQSPITRLEGFSANQLFLTFSGTGCFRLLGEDKWDIVPPKTLLYIPAGLPHEYGPQESEPWRVGYITFVEKEQGPLHHWGFGNTFLRANLHDISPLYELLYTIWNHSGSNYDAWLTAAQLFSFCLEVKKQSTTNGNKGNADAPKTVRYRNSVVHHATRFLQDHLQRNLVMTELSSYVGYSPKQLTRLFQEALGITPLQYQQKIRLQTAAQLMEQNPNMTIRQIAAHIGMESVYFTRLFRRLYGVVPSKYRD